MKQCLLDVSVTVHNVLYETLRQSDVKTSRFVNSFQHLRDNFKNAYLSHVHHAAFIFKIRRTSRKTFFFIL